MPATPSSPTCRDRVGHKELYHIVGRETRARHGDACVLLHALRGTVQLYGRQSIALTHDVFGRYTTIKIHGPQKNANAHHGSNGFSPWALRKVAMCP